MIAGKTNAARRKALSDAAAGVIGSLVSMLAFYPVDVWKTTLQASVTRICIEPKDAPEDNSNDNKINFNRNYDANPNKSANHLRVLFSKKLSQLFRGLPFKIIHTTVSSFTYFFVHSLVHTKYKLYRRSLRSDQSIHDKESDKNFESTITNLALTAFAAIINTCITLPFDTISSRKQVMDVSDGDEKIPLQLSSDISIQTCDDIHCQGSLINEELLNTHCRISSQKNQSVGKETQDNMGYLPALIYSDEQHNGVKSIGLRNSDEPVHEESPQRLYIKNPEKFKFSFSTNLPAEAFSTENSVTICGSNRSYRQRLRSILHLWNGLLPSVLLCTNPAIQYTMYDTLKHVLLQRRKFDWNSKGENQEIHLSKLSMWEAFLFGLISKFFATIVTYPLIRAKVCLMLAASDAIHCENSDVIEEEKSFTKKRIGTFTNIWHRNHPRSLILLLLYIFKQDGIQGIYRGCSVQLLHTILKSALSMMVREKITHASREFFNVKT